jgi:hypothetical protein
MGTDVCTDTNNESRVIGGGGTARDASDRGGGVHARGALRTWASAGGWLFAQVLWLALAYCLEFRGLGVFVPLWSASLLFLLANAWLMVELMGRHTPETETKTAVKARKSRVE